MCFRGGMNLLTHFACLDCRDPFLQGSRFLMMINSKHKFYAGKIQIILFSVCVCVCLNLCLTTLNLVKELK